MTVGIQWRLTCGAIMKRNRSKRASIFMECLERRTLLSGSPSFILPGYFQSLFQPQTSTPAQAASAQTLASIISAALAAAPAGDPIYMKYQGITGNVTAS